MAVNNSLSSVQQGTLAAPQVGNAVTQSMVAKEQARIQGQVFMAKQFPRDMTMVMNRIEAVSYTHLDVYKRQGWE